MYFYLFDSFLQESKYRHDLQKIENRLTTLGIQGRQEKMTILKNPLEATAQAIKRGATTIVAIGNDKTMTRILPVVLEHRVTLGCIPLGQPQTIAEFLGIPIGPDACDILSRRVIQNLDVGEADGHFFMLEATVPAAARVTCDSQYTVESTDPQARISISNLRPMTSRVHPNDGRLELVVSAPTRSMFSRHRPSPMSVFPIRKAKI
ncbi:MAG: hypothetical protein HY092_00790, partial [Candidatus Kerfeldbacteria bacterium]|nr:hypothetical protein [Candidatus Kerfeldbacteria bacterium]